MYFYVLYMIKKSFCLRFNIFITFTPMLQYDELLHWIEESGFELVEVETYFDSAYLRFACGLCLGLKESLLKKESVDCVFSQHYKDNFKSIGLIFNNRRHCLYWPVGDVEFDGESNSVRAFNSVGKLRAFNFKTDFNLEEAIEMLKRMLR